MKEKTVGCMVKFSIFWERFKSWLFKIRMLIFMLLFFLCAGLVRQLLKGHVGFVKSLVEDSTLAGIVATLLGAFVGGFFTLLGTICVNRLQIKTQAYIRRKNVIYKPLYDELVEIHNSILKQNPYPLYIEFEKRQQTLLPHPQFSAWPRMKMDSRYLETPPKLKRVLDQLENIMHEYEKKRREASKSIQKICNDVMLEKTDAECSITNIGDVISGDVLSQDKTSLLDDRYWDHCMMARKENIDKTLQGEIIDLLLDRCEENENVRCVRKLYADWLQTEESAISLLGAMIQHISTTCEG